MVKNKALPDSARPCKPVWSFSLSLSLSLSPSQTWPYQGWSHVSSPSFTDAIHPEGAPWILLKLDPGTCTYMTMHSERATSPRIPSHFMLPSWVQELRKGQVLNREWWWWSPSFMHSNLLEESLYDKKTKPLIKSLPPSVPVNYGLGTFSEYKVFHCNLFLHAGMKNQIGLHRLTRNVETLATWRQKKC